MFSTTKIVGVAGFMLTGPSGCRVYPVIFDEEVGVILDDLCPDRGTISQEEKDVKGNRVVKLLERIDVETAKRHVKQS